uniref:Sulfatase N-terminal domain-containing protein n=1 Tax=Haptolina ericina TaxID=156174 RepID=A0A7S3C5C5_9EUKA|mmetsp:Transcript_8569/g.19073  ORF Transcript_8569/g.19073 Transcript_8569/m.19073 type:complete len:201 (+) Transcript_8569:214-816(+)
MFIHIPDLTDKGITTSHPTEYLDLMPTLAEAAMGVIVPPCPRGVGASRKVKLCTHGTSLLPLISDPTTEVKLAAYSQYPRGYVKPGEKDHYLDELDPFGPISSQISSGSTPSPSACLTKHCTMGYSMLTRVNGTEYRYTEWVDFNTKVSGGPDWDRNVGTELYHHGDDPLENINIAASAAPALLAKLSKRLHQHPVLALA